MNDPNKHNLVAHGVSTCAGCALEIIIRNVLSVLGDNTVIVIPPGCSALFSGYGKNTALKIAGFQGNLENTAAIASGIRAGFNMQGKHDITVLGFAGDGATVDIGLQALSGMFERGDRVLYICYDNEAYMNTGTQASGSTPLGAKTSTTPYGKKRSSKNMLDIARAHLVPYIASASVAYLSDLRNKVQKGSLVNGPAYIHVHAPCPTGWGFSPNLTINIAKLAVQTGCWMLCEIENGVISMERGAKDLLQVENYLKLQGRFKNLTKNEMASMQEQINKNFLFYEAISKITKDFSF